MADSENSTTMPQFTPENLLKFIEPVRGAVLRDAAERLTASNADLCARSGVDPVVSYWRRWSVTHARSNELCRLQQGLETKLLKKISSLPQAEQERVSSRIFHSIDQISGHDAGSEVADVQEYAITELQEAKINWHEINDELDYRSAYRDHLQILDREFELAEALFNAPAKTLVGIVAKLHCILEMRDPLGVEEGEPWPLLRSILFDLLRVEKDSSW
ncbi:hypothetical protein FHW20_003177 [Ochrobactrum intermedium]|uniref:DUF3102 domain-containing protein n=1 Tax=Brucella intermedia TaxID=94625 RepID=A0ABR6ARX9_9HYPH|nr:hypothetical protein [Brucella intermedia]MBA8852223.1 hypothetical protein [Brucella intermedia]